MARRPRKEAWARYSAQNVAGMARLLENHARHEVRPHSRPLDWRSQSRTGPTLAAMVRRRDCAPGYCGLACIIAIAWDTQFSPVDVRTLAARHRSAVGDRLI